MIDRELLSVWVRTYHATDVADLREALLYRLENGLFSHPENTIIKSNRYKVTYRLWNEYETIVEDCDSPETAESDVRSYYFEDNGHPVNGGMEIIEIKDMREDEDIQS
jgi:hypothetical protein